MSAGSWIRNPPYQNELQSVFTTQPIRWTPPPSLTVLIGSEWTNRRTGHTTHTSCCSLCNEAVTVLPSHAFRVFKDNAFATRRTDWASANHVSDLFRFVICRYKRGECVTRLLSRSKITHALHVDESRMTNLNHFFESLAMIQLSDCSSRGTLNQDQSQFYTALRRRSKLIRDR